jgi:hypothetical protein
MFIPKKIKRIKMKKVIGLLVSAFLLLGLMSTSAMADAAKGQKYYLKYMKDGSGLNGAKFATHAYTSRVESSF